MNNENTLFVIHLTEMALIILSILTGLKHRFLILLILITT